MTVSIRRMSVGAGFEYLMGSVARGDGGVPASSPLTRYYLESGTPAGIWLGRGLAGLADGDGVTQGTVVSEEGLWNLLGMLADPVTGRPLGRAPRRDRPEQSSHGVAGFDLTFSVPKSVSTLWALADAQTQQLIHQAHRDAIAMAIGWAEDNIAFTRTGAGGRVQERVRGLGCAAFDHWDSRTGDPHLHTHVVLANRVQTSDGAWRTLDGATLFRYTVALSELHEGLVHDLLTERLGVTWTARTRQHSAALRWDINGIPSELIETFSSRSRAIADGTSDLIDGFAVAHGRHPTNVEILQLRQRATLETRPDKHQLSLAQHMDEWRSRAADVVPGSIDELVASAIQRRQKSAPTLLEDGTIIDVLAASVLNAVASKKAVFTEANVLAEAHRQLHGHTFTTAQDRLTAAQLITASALDDALLLDEPSSERVAHRGTVRYSTPAIFDAETRLLDAGRALDGPAIEPDAVSAHTTNLGDDQAAAVVAIGESARSVDLLVGPAGTGKTTSLNALRVAWESVHGAGSVVGLAPSAAAAQVLGDELGIDTDNTSKWLLEHRRTPERDRRIAALEHDIAATISSPGTARGRRLHQQLATERDERARWALHTGWLLIIDESSLAGTLALDEIVTAARATGAKTLLVGDWAQLDAIDAGGAFHMLAADRPDAAQLNTVRRFTEPWEAQASLQLRDGNAEAIDAYLAHGRMASGDRTEMLHAVFDAWAHDTDAGLNSTMIALDDATVRDLNALAQAHRRDTGGVTTGTVPLRDGHFAGVGDRIVTRHNDRRLRTSNREWVKNGDAWTVTGHGPDGAVTVTRDDGSSMVRLPAQYVAEHVELGYAATIHRAQGSTVDTAHAVIDGRARREALYVAMSRGRHENHLYIDTADHHDSDMTHGASATTGTGILRSILTRTVDTSAHAATELIDPALAPDAFRPVDATRKWAVPDYEAGHPLRRA